MKEQNTFLAVLDKVQCLDKKISDQIEGIRWVHGNGNTDAAYRHALYLDECVERMVLLTRSLPVCTGRPRVRDDVRAIESKVIPIEIGYTGEGWFCVRIPALLPRKESGSADWLRFPLYHALQNFFAPERPCAFFDNCVLIYRHVYDRTTPTRRKRDHDNIEINMVSDAVALYVMSNDGPETCRHFYCSAEGNAHRTEVYVVPKNEFMRWYEAEPSIPEEGVTLYEECPSVSKKRYVKNAHFGVKKITYVKHARKAA